MWRSRINSRRKDSNNNNNECLPKIRKIPSNPDFNHQSLKDIETLCPHGTISDLNPIPEAPSASSLNCSTPAAVPTEVKRSSIFHRIHLINRVSRAFSARPKPAQEDFISDLNIPVAAEKSDSNNAVAAEKSESNNPVAAEKSESNNPSVAEKSDTNNAVAAEKSENLEKSVKADKLEKVEGAVKPEPPIEIPGSDQRVVVYMTSLRVVRPTFEACRTVRSILQGFRVPVDERDLSMDSAFFDEIRKIMAQIGEGRSDDKRVDLPKVFIGGRYIGGADEVVELHEIGELKKFVKGLPAVTPGGCKFCGGFRFVLCYECNGSHKCPTEDGGFRTCTECNENGLIRCPTCSSS